MTDKSMIERVKAAIIEADSGLLVRHYDSIARAAIEAMREPTDAMEDAGIAIGDDNTPLCTWHAMIDAALSEPKTE